MDSLNDEEGKTGREKKKEGRKLSNLNELRLNFPRKNGYLYILWNLCNLVNEGVNDSDMIYDKRKYFIEVYYRFNKFETLGNLD